METWGIGEYVCAVIVAGILVVLVTCYPKRLREEAVRRQAETEALRLPDWSSIRNYFHLAQAASKAYRLPVDEFLGGPYRRFLEICSDPADNPRARARAMEFARGVLDAYREQQTEADPVDVHRKARAMAIDHFARADVPGGEYMLEVFDGVSNHNWRGRRDDCG